MKLLTACEITRRIQFENWLFEIHIRAGCKITVPASGSNLFCFLKTFTLLNKPNTVFVTGP